MHTHLRTIAISEHCLNRNLLLKKDPLDMDNIEDIIPLLRRTAVPAEFLEEIGRIVVHFAILEHELVPLQLSNA